MVAYFAFEQVTLDGELREFIFKLVDESTISEARAIFNNPKAKVHVQGTIVPKPVAYNPDWFFRAPGGSVRRERAVRRGAPR